MGLIFKIYGYLSVKIENFKVSYYKYRLKVKNLNIYFPVFIEQLENLKIGENVAINAFVHIWATVPVEIGENTMIAAHVQITTATHDYAMHPMRNTRIDKEIKIGKNVWIGSGAIIFPGVTIGDNVVIGAGTLVNKDIPSGKIAYGVPVRIIKEII